MAQNKDWDKKCFKLQSLVSICSDSWLTDGPCVILDRGRGNGARRDSSAVTLLFSMDTSPLHQAVPWELQALALLPGPHPTGLSIVQVEPQLWGAVMGGLAWKNLIPVSSPGLETKQWESLSFKELTSLGCVLRGGAGQTASKCHQGEPNNNYSRANCLCPSPSCPSLDTVTTGEVQRDSMSPHLHTLQINQAHLSPLPSPEP